MHDMANAASAEFPPDFAIQPAELTLAFSHLPGERRLSFARHAHDPAGWRQQCKQKLAALLNVQAQQPCAVRELRQVLIGEGIAVKAMVMHVSDQLDVPAYLLVPRENCAPHTAVMAIHGHGEAEPCIGLGEDYHHQFALALARAGYLVLCPELRGFGALKDVAVGAAGQRLDYWNWGGAMAYSLVTDGFQHGHTLIGDTVADLLRWEEWLAQMFAIQHLHVAGISYGGDLALTYPVFSGRVDRIFASGTLGSFSVIFSRCYNAPAHCIPGVLQWMDRSDIAGLNAPRPLVLHYGELDTPGDDNYSASYNHTVEPSVHELRAIYKAFGAEDALELLVTVGKRHEMDNEALLSFFANTAS